MTPCQKCGGECRRDVFDTIPPSFGPWECSCGWREDFGSFCEGRILDAIVGKWVGRPLTAESLIELVSEMRAVRDAAVSWYDGCGGVA